jgi:hypothetical protein
MRVYTFKSKFTCPKCGTTFYAMNSRPRCPVENFGHPLKASLGAVVNYPVVVV